MRGAVQTPAAAVAIIAVLVGVLFFAAPGPVRAVWYEERTLLMPADYDRMATMTVMDGWQLVGSSQVAGNVYAVRLERPRLRLP